MKPLKFLLQSAAVIVMLIAILDAHAARPENRKPYPISRMEANDANSDLKPAIDSISDLTYHLDEYTFNAEFTVYFHGTDKINIELEEEFNTMILREYYEGPGEVHVKTGNLTRKNYSWIYIRAKNEYGSAERILEFPPFFTDPADGYKTFEIACDEMPESGILSAYTRPGFYIKTDIPALSSLGWSLTMPLKDGGSEDIILNKRYADCPLSCIISPFDDPSAYDVTEDGLLEATLNFSGILPDGSTLSCTYDITFDFKPFIEYAVIERIEDEDPSPSYNAYYKVKYYGADKIRVYVEEEHRSEVKLTYINEPYIAYGCATHVTAPYKAWIDFVVENSYGKDTYTIELLPYGEVANSVESIPDDFSAAGSSHGPIDVYDTHGRKIAVINDISEAYGLPVKGLLILKTPSGTKKIMTQ